MAIKFDWLKEIIGDTYTEELDQKVADALGKRFAALNDFNNVNETKKQLQADLAARDKQLTELKTAAGLSEDLKKQIETLQAANKTAQEKYETDLKDLALTNAIKLAVTGKVHDEALVTGLVDKTKLVVNGDSVIGLDEQLKTLQESKAFLFKSDGDKGNDGKGGNQNKPGFKVGAGAGETGGGGGQQQPASLRDAIASAMKSQLGKS